MLKSDSHGNKLQISLNSPTGKFWSYDFKYLVIRRLCWSISQTFFIEDIFPLVRRLGSLGFADDFENQVLCDPVLTWSSGFATRMLLWGQTGSLSEGRGPCCGLKEVLALLSCPVAFAVRVNDVCRCVGISTVKLYEGFCFLLIFRKRWRIAIKLKGLGTISLKTWVPINISLQM